MSLGDVPLGSRWNVALGPAQKTGAAEDGITTPKSDGGAASTKDPGHSQFQRH
jgi:hypothetical protein